MNTMLPLANHCINCSIYDVSILVNLAQLFQQSSVTSVQRQGFTLIPRMSQCNSLVQLDNFTVQ